MNNTWLVLDVTNLCYRALHAMGDLTHEGHPTGVLFGFMRDIAHLQEKFATKRIVFCFDVGESFRCNMFRGYKASRREHFEKKTPKEQEARKNMHKQIYLLRTEYLTKLGYNNLHFKDGYEADDLIASVIDNNKKDDFIIASSDKDLYQLLSKNRVRIWNTFSNKWVTEKWFMDRYSIYPAEWPLAKALMGDSDDIPGIPEVGDVTACKYINGTLPENSKGYKNIIAMKEQWEFYLQLTELPWANTPVIPLKKDKPNQTAWVELTKQLGMTSLSHIGPLGTSKWAGMHREVGLVEG